MLDEKTLEWLRTREKEEYYNGYYFCAHSNEIRSAEWNNRTGRGDVPWVIDTKDDYKDAAEFEARVVVKLTNVPIDCYVCPIFPCQNDCSLERLKWARLSVEEELEKEDME